MTEITNAYDWSGRTIVGSDGETIGKIDDLYLVEDKPEGPGAHRALGHQAFVRAACGASPRRGRGPRSQGRRSSTPRVEPDGELCEQEEMALFEHYGVPYTSRAR